MWQNTYIIKKWNTQMHKYIKLKKCNCMRNITTCIKWNSYIFVTYIRIRFGSQEGNMKRFVLIDDMDNVNRSEMNH